MPPKPRDRTGDRFGLWTVTGLTEKKNGRQFVPCICDCGTSRLVQLSNLMNRKTSSCGCEKDRKSGERFYKHGTGYSDYRYSTWKAIKDRCLRPWHKNWKDYGGRGITLYAPWIDDFPAFAQYLDKELGVRPDGHSLDRIDNDRNYEPGNLRWATRHEQAMNRRGTAPVSCPNCGFHIARKGNS